MIETTTYRRRTPIQAKGKNRGGGAGLAGQLHLPTPQQPQPEVIVLGYVEGALWRLVVFPPAGVKGHEVPQIQRQVLGGGWEAVAHDDLLAHLAWRAYRRGRRLDDHKPSHSGLVVPGEGS